MKLAKRKILLVKLCQILKNSDRTIGIGSTRASLESNFALLKLVGTENFYIGASRTESQLVSIIINILMSSPVPAASIHDVDLADAVLVLGEDVPNTAPMLELSLRKATLRKLSALAKKLKIEEWNDVFFREVTQQEKGALFIATPDKTRLDDAAAISYRAAPDDLARLGFAVAHELNPDAPSVPELADEVRRMAQKLAEELKNSENPIIVSGVNSDSRSVIEASANIAYALHSMNKKPKLCFAVPYCNSMGLGLMGGQSIDSVKTG